MSNRLFTWRLDMATDCRGKIDTQTFDRTASLADATLVITLLFSVGGNFQGRVSYGNVLVVKTIIDSRDPRCVMSSMPAMMDRRSSTMGKAIKVNTFLHSIPVDSAYFRAFFITFCSY